MSVLRTTAVFLAKFAAVCFGWVSDTAKAETSYFEYRGICDASAAVALDANSFVVASDEVNILQVYRRDQPTPIRTVDLYAFLNVDRESDIEGAAAIGSRIYWITSHGANDKGKFRPDRQRFFATDIVTQGGGLTVAPVGRAYADLLADLLNAPQLNRYRLREASRLAPKAFGALNIEGLAATADGKLLIGFRNPLPAGQALIVPLENPAEVISGAKAVLGQPIELSLGGLGIRSIDRVGNEYLIIAGPYDNAGKFTLYKWSGVVGDAPVASRGINFKDMNPEALFAIPGTDMIQVLSDDGAREIGGIKCKDLPDAEQSFRSMTLRP